MPLTVRMDDGLDELAQRIVSGELDILVDTSTVPLDAFDRVLDIESLQNLARLCDRDHLHVEAARIRRWLAKD
jgi:hypothetical protein